MVIKRYAVAYRGEKMSVRESCQDDQKTQLLAFADLTQWVSRRSTVY